VIYRPDVLVLDERVGAGERIAIHGAIPYTVSRGADGDNIVYCCGFNDLIYR
jgi:hypothetical protein